MPIDSNEASVSESLDNSIIILHSKTNQRNVWSAVNKYFADENIDIAPQNPLPNVTISAKRKFLKVTKNQNVWN